MSDQTPSESRPDEPRQEPTEPPSGLGGHAAPPPPYPGPTPPPATGGWPAAPSGQQPHAPQGYPPPGYPPPGYAPPGWAQHQGHVPAGPGFPAPGWGPPAQSNAKTAMVFGIVGLASGWFTCGLGFAFGIVAWILGAKSKNAIDREPGRWSGRGDAQAGFVMGIIATGLLVIAVIGWVVLIIVLANDPTAFDDTDDAIGLLLRLR